MDGETELMVVRGAVVIAVVLAAFNWRNLGDDVKIFLTIGGIVVLWSLPIFLLRSNGWAQISWLTLGLAVGATAIARRDGAPWVNYANTPFVIASAAALTAAVW